MKNKNMMEMDRNKYKTTEEVNNMMQEQKENNEEYPKNNYLIMRIKPNCTQ